MNTGIKGNEIVASDTTATAVAVEWRIWQRRRSILLGGMLTTAAAVGIPIGFAPGLSPARGESLPALALTETADATPVRLEFRGHRFVIPRNYFRYPPELDPEAKGGFLLRVLLPDMAPYTAATASAFYAPGLSRKMNVLIHNEPQIRPLDELLAITLEGRPLESPSQGTYGLAHALIPDNRDDLYVGVTPDGVEPYIRCRPIRPPLGSSCSHYFEWNGLDIQLGYDRKHLSLWLEIQHRTIALLVAFEEDPATER